MSDEIKKRGGIGILTDSDIPKINAACRRVLTLMSDYEWHTSTEIDQAAGVGGCPARRGLARLFDLKEHGYPYEKRRRGASGIWEFRLIKKEKETAKQIDLLKAA